MHIAAYKAVVEATPRCWKIKRHITRKSNRI
jgi:hypothetical protein